MANPHATPSAHTKAPWLMQLDPLDGTHERYEVVAECGGLIANDLHDDDARLIAASPVLLDACIKAVRRLRAINGEAGGPE